ncbi:MAG: type II toxin-antitoxin system RelB/DinJ family antitoxin [Gammaproteobacteria bacterium]|nr:type II toxin-antitoxin system RelB/DinJ family antitoxin [Gammaproteobacteria bacterium]
MSTARNTIVRARVNDHIKHNVEQILDHLGLTMSDAINALFSQISLRKGLPFDVKIPNKATRKAIEEAREGKNLTRFDSAEDLFKDLGI